MCDKHKWLDIVLLVIIIVVAIWSPPAWGVWVIVIAALIVLIHQFVCKCCTVEVKSKSKKREK